MANIRDQLETIESEVNELYSISSRSALISEETFERISDLRIEVLDAMVRIGEVTEAAIQNLRDELSVLQSELAKAVGMSGILHFKGQQEQAHAITESSRNALSGNVLQGIFQMCGMAVIGGAVKVGFSDVRLRFCSRVYWKKGLT